jgi:hypothetical protein
MGVYAGLLIDFDENVGILLRRCGVTDNVLAADREVVALGLSESGSLRIECWTDALTIGASACHEYQKESRWPQEYGWIHCIPRGSAVAERATNSLLIPCKPLDR